MIDAVFADWKSDHPGGWVAVQRGDDRLHFQSYGRPSLQHDILWTSKTRLRIYSMTKNMVAVAMLLAEDRGLLKLGNDARQYLPELPDYGTPITVAHLLTHTSGLRDNEAVQFLAGIPEAAPLSFSYALELIGRQQRLNHRPGHHVLYCNTGFRLLAEILSRVSGQSFEQLMKAEIFQPLGMNETDVFATDGAVIPNLATGYTRVGSGAFRLVPCLASTTGDGGVVSTIDDMLRWTNGFRTNPLGIRDLIERLTSVPRLPDGRLSRYAIGTALDDYQGIRAFGHGGAWFGYTSEFIRFPEQDCTIIILANYLHAELEPRIRRIADLVLSDEAARPKTAKSRVTLSKADIADKLGWYVNEELGFAVAVTPPRLETDYENGVDLQITAVMRGLRATSLHDFVAASAYSSSTARFETRAGRRPLLWLDVGMESPIAFEPASRIYANPAELEFYVGIYGSAELNAVHRVYMVGEKLYHLRGGGEWPDDQVCELQMIGPDLFVLDYPHGQFTTVKFRRSRRGRVQSLALTNRGARFLELKRLPDPVGAGIVRPPDQSPALRSVIPFGHPRQDSRQKT